MGKMTLRLHGVTDGPSLRLWTSRRSDDKLRGYYGRVQGVFQDPFSSYNPVFNTDRVFDDDSRRALSPD